MFYVIIAYNYIVGGFIVHELIILMEANYLITIYVFFILLSTMSIRIFYASFFYLFYLMIDKITGKTTLFNVNIIATIGLSVSLVGNLVQYFQNKNLKKKKGGK